MRSYHIAATALAVTSLATVQVAAQPAAPAPASCSVDVVRAPDGARKIVEAWLATTRRCSVALEVRIVETNGGLYVIARDDRGTVRDRVVPDAQTAGALVASWADDGQPAPIATIDVHTEVQLVPVPLPSREPPSLDPIVDPTGGPGAAPFATSQRDDGGEHVRTRPHHWVGEFLELGGTSGGVHGLRGEVDVLHGSTWTAGVALTIGTEARSASNGTYMEDQELSDIGGSIYIARPFRAGGWELRPAIGVGLVYTRVYDLQEPLQEPLGSFETVHTSAFAEASLLASHDLIGNLAVSAGAVLTAYGQQFNSMIPDLQSRDFDAAFVAGLRFGFL